MTNGSDSNLVMPVSPMYGGYGNGGFGNCFGGDSWAWVILLLLLAGNGGWGNGFGGGYDGGVMPYMWNTQTQNDVNRGFDTASLANQLSGIQSAIPDGFAGAEIANCNRAMDAMQTAYNNQIASMNQRFADTQFIGQGFYNLQSQLAQCCCDNRLATNDLKATIATEACATRQNNTANTQSILDKLCQLELDGYKRENDQLRSQLQFANLQASQVAQTAEIRTSQATTANQLVSELRSCPIPAQPVYGNQPIFTCGVNSATGCGCGL